MVVKRGDLLVPLDRNPLEIYLLGLCVLAGSAGVYNLARGGVPADGAPVVLAWVFDVLLVAGGIGGIVGAFWKDAITGVLIVRAAMIPTAAASLAYGLGLLGGGPGAVVGALSVFGFAVACGWRVWDITRHVRDQARGRVVLNTDRGGPL